MTRQRTFKQSVRDRMQKTGERYTAARAMMLRDRSEVPPDVPAGLFPGYPAPGGVCTDTGSLRSVLAARGLPLSEALVTGVCGGISFLYAMFEYPTTPPLLSILGRYDTMPDSFIGGGLKRLGVKPTIRETGSTKLARQSLDDAIAKRQPALCVVDCVAIAADADDADVTPGCQSPTVVAVAGADGDRVLIDDGGPTLRSLTRDRFDRARAIYKKGRNRIITFDEPLLKLDLVPVVREAIAATVHRFTNPPYKSFANNFGFAGLEKWRRLLTDPKDKKGWPTVFPEGRLAYLALRRVHDGIEHEFTAPAAGRPLYADFLNEASKLAGGKAYAAAAKLFQASGAEWSAIAETIRTCGDPAVEEGCRLRESFRELLDEVERPDEDAAKRLQREQQSLAAKCRMTKARANEAYASLTHRVKRIADLEREAVAELRG